MVITRQILSNGSGPDLMKLQEAEAAIAAFERSPVPGVWPFLDKAMLITEMRQRLQHPTAVCQGGQPFCGPASVLFELVRKQPQRYVEICQTLFLTGGFQGKNSFIAASDQLRRDSYGNLRMSQADWMVLATLRDVENILFPVDPDAPELIRSLAGMTKSWEMKGWIQEILGYSNVDYHHAYLLNDLSAMKAAEQAIQQGGVAFALITAEALLEDKPPKIPFPSHWIALLGNLAIEPDSIGFNLYTWSKQMRLEVDIPTFRKYFWATVTATP